MKALVYENVNQISLKEIQEPEFPKNDWVKIQVAACGLCGSDIHKFFHQKPSDNYLTTSVLGHEISGIVIEIGVGVTDISIGDRVAVEPLIPCGNCTNCLQGKSQLCNNILCIGRNYNGGFTERILVPARNIWKIPENISFNEGTQIDLVAVAVHALNVSKPNNESWSCAVIGDGSLGIITAQVAKAYGANEIILFAKHKFKKDIAQQLGFKSLIIENDNDFVDNYKNHFDVVFETVGGRQSNTINNGITITSPSGKLIVLGVFDFGFNASLNVREAFYKEVSIIGINSYSKFSDKSDFATALSLISTGIIDVNKIITHKINLQNYLEAFSLVQNKSEVIKIVFENS